MTALDTSAHLERLVSLLASDLELGALGVRVARTVADLPAPDVRPYPRCVAVEVIETGRAGGFTVLLLVARAATREALEALVYAPFRLERPFGAVLDALQRARPDLDGFGSAEWCRRVDRRAEVDEGSGRIQFHEARELVRAVFVP